MRNSRGPLNWFAVGAVAAALGACGSTAMMVGAAGQGDAAADHEGFESDATGTDATSTDAGTDAAPFDAGVVIIPCSIGNAFLTCTLPGGGGCECTSDLATCNSFCDAAGCQDPCADASCTNRCAPDQIAMGCGGPPRPPPPPWDDGTPRVTYVFADPPDVCALAPGGGGPEIVFFCCPRELVDR